MNLREGVLKNVLVIMEAMGHNLTGFEKVTVLSFEEVKVNSVYEYDTNFNEIVGPHN